MWVIFLVSAGGLLLVHVAVLFIVLEQRIIRVGVK